MPAHLIADDDTTPAALDPHRHAGWLALSAAMTDQAPDIADREDLIVTIAPGAAHGNPACFFPTRAAIEVDGTHLGGIDPATATPARPADRARYATAWGLLTHECAHAAHSAWTAPGAAPTAAVDAAMQLEESRIEAAQIRRRPVDRHWLRASATGLILADTHADDPAAAPPMTPWAAAQAAALVLARVDAGILTTDETAALARTVESILGPDQLTALREIWQTAHTVGDDDTETMLVLGRRWCEAVGADPDAPTPGTPGASTPGGPGAPAEEAAPPQPSPLAEAITETAAAIAANVAAEPAPTAEDPAAAVRDAEAAARQAAEQAAAKVFGIGGARTGRTATAGTRPPSAEEKAAARRLSRALSTAGRRDRTTTTVTSAVPPGRLRMRGALAADAQRAAGQLPTAEPFTQRVHRSVPTPPLRLGIACDVSGSMQDFAAPVASAAWILARAAHLTPMPATTATVIFGNRVRPITRPGIAPAAVTEFHACDNWEDIATAIDALDHTLGLSRPGAARLLVIVSDGMLRADPRRHGQQRIDRLRAAGCAVLWLTPDGTITAPLRGVTLHPLTDPAGTADAIGRAATTALRTTT